MHSSITQQNRMSVTSSQRHGFMLAVNEIKDAGTKKFAVLTRVVNG